MPDFNDEAIAAKLYGGAAVAPAPAQAAQDKPSQDRQSADPEAMAERLYSDPVDHVGPDGYDKLHASTERGIAQAAVERFGLEPDEGRAVAAEWSQTWRNYDIDPGEAATLTEVGIGVLSGAVEADLQGWSNMARQGLVQDFGSSADQALDAARRLVAKDLKLHAMLETTGLGSHPKIVCVLAQKAWALKRAGRL